MYIPKKLPHYVSISPCLVLAPWIPRAGSGWIQRPMDEKMEKETEKVGAMGTWEDWAHRIHVIRDIYIIII